LWDTAQVGIEAMHLFRRGSPGECTERAVRRFRRSLRPSPAEAIAGAKKPETRAARIRKTLEMLGERRG
jgi:hypothetical protein